MEKIKKLRIERGFSQLEIAKTIGVARSTYTAIEAGKQELSLEEAKKLATLFGVSIDELSSGNISNINKYKHMILTFLRMNISNDGKIPKTKLAKMLYLADFSWYYDHLESMSGMQYRKIEYGPVPDTFFRAIEELEMDGKIKIDHKCSTLGKESYLISENESNKNEKIQTISNEEKNLMKKIVDKWKGKNTKDIVNFTHNQLPYTICRDNELIPYELIIQEDPDMVY
jgi:DNA-binding XRE family transcriptional regulator